MPHFKILIKSILNRMNALGSRHPVLIGDGVVVEVLIRSFFMQDGVKDENGMVKCNFNVKGATEIDLVAGSED